MASLTDHNAEHFNTQAKTWDAKAYVVEVAEGISQKIAEKIDLSDKALLDLGAGTGLVAQRLAAKAKLVVGVDVSPEMVKGLNSKRDQYPNIVGLCVNITDEDAFATAVKSQDVPDTFDVTYIHLTLHHIEDVEGIVKRLAALTKTGGYVVVSDLLKTGNWHIGQKDHAHHTVAHFGGFEPEFITQLMEGVGLHNVDITPNAVLMRREHEEQNGEKVLAEHPVFLAIAQKQ